MSVLLLSIESGLLSQTSLKEHSDQLQVTYPSPKSVEIAL